MEPEIKPFWGGSPVETEDNGSFDAFGVVLVKWKAGTVMKCTVTEFCGEFHEVVLDGVVGF